MSNPSALTETLAKRVVELEERNAKLTKALFAAYEHLQFCDWGMKLRSPPEGLKPLIKDAFNKGE